MDQYTTYVAFDTSKETLAVAIAESGGHKEVLFFGAIASWPEAVHKLIDKLAMQHPRPAFCYGVGPTGYGLYRQIRAMGYECRVVMAPRCLERHSGGPGEKPAGRVNACPSGGLSQTQAPRPGNAAVCYIRHRPCKLSLQGGE